MDTEERKFLLTQKNSAYYGTLQEEERKEEQRSGRKGIYQEGSGWLVVLTSFLCMCLVHGIIFSCVVFQDPLLSDLCESRDTVSLAGGMQVFLAGATTSVAGYWVRRTGARSVCCAGAVTAAFGLLLASFGSSIVGIILGVSLLAGVGLGMMYISAVVMVAQTFTTRSYLALGLTLCGASAGLIVLYPGVVWVVELWGWRCGLQLLCVATLGCGGLVWGAWTETTKTTETSTEEKNVSGIADHDYLTVFLIVVLGDSLALVSLYTLYSHLAVFGHLPVTTIIGLGSVPGILGTGWVTDQSWCQPLYLTTTMISISTIIPFILTWVENTWMITMVTIIFGFISGSWATATSPVLISLLGLDHLTQSLGLLTTTRCVAYLVFPSLTTPLLALQISGILSLLAGSVYSAAIWTIQRKRSKAGVYQNI